MFLCYAKLVLDMTVNYHGLTARNELNKFIMSSKNLFWEWITLTCGDGEIGKRTGLKILRGNTLTGSTPVLRITGSNHQ